MAMIPVLSTQRLTLRGPDARDVALLQAFYASDRSKFVGGPKDADDAWRQLACEIGHWTLKGYGRWIVEADGVQVGLIGLWNPHGWPEAEIGWDLFEGAEGKGYATEAATAARTYAYDTLGWTTAISLVSPGNAASAAVAKRMGATLESQQALPKLGAVDIYRHPAPEALQ